MWLTQFKTHNKLVPSKRLLLNDVDNFVWFQGQFCIAFLHSAQLLWQDCGFPRWSLFFTLPNAIFFYYLFYDFYNKAYPHKRLKKNSASVNGGIANGKIIESSPTSNENAENGKQYKHTFSNGDTPKTNGIKPICGDATSLNGTLLINSVVESATKKEL